MQSGLFLLKLVCCYRVDDTVASMFAQESMQLPGFYEKNPFSDPSFFQFCWTLSNTPTKSVSTPPLSSHLTSPSSTPLPQFLSPVPLVSGSPAWSSVPIHSTSSRCHPTLTSCSCPKELTVLRPASHASKGMHLMDHFPQAPLSNIFC